MCFLQNMVAPVQKLIKRKYKDLYLKIYSKQNLVDWVNLIQFGNSQPYSCLSNVEINTFLFISDVLIFIQSIQRQALLSMT